MPLFNIISIAGLNISFNIGFAFIKSKQEGDYMWVLQQLAASASVQPTVYVTDWDLALMNAIDVVFSDS